MTRIFLALLFLLAAAQPALAKDWCEPDMSGLKMISAVDTSFSSQLVACGLEVHGAVSGLIVLYVENNKKMVVFEGDSNKSYRLEQAEPGFYIQESIDDSAAFRPFIGIRTGCDAQKRCSSIDSACLWRKTPTTHALDKLMDAAKSEPEKTGGYIKDVFKDALGGDADAIAWFGQNHFFNGDAQDVFRTHQMDIARLKKLNCL